MGLSLTKQKETPTTRLMVVIRKARILNNRRWWRARPSGRHA
jgi:hypothetical protein